MRYRRLSNRFQAFLQGSRARACDYVYATLIKQVVVPSTCSRPWRSSRWPLHIRRTSRLACPRPSVIAGRPSITIGAVALAARRVSPFAVMLLAWLHVSFGIGPHRRERDPGLSQFRSKCGAKLLLQAPNQRFAKRDEVRRADSKMGMLATRMGDDRLEQLALVKRADDCRDHVHEFEVLSFHVAGE
jgi:hypothetical protein